MTQEEFDKLPYRTIHLVIDGSDPPRALCSGLEWHPASDPQGPVKQCQACLNAALHRGAQLVGVHGGADPEATQDHPSNPADRTGLG